MTDVIVMRSYDEWCFEDRVNSAIKDGYIVSSTAILGTERAPIFYAILIKSASKNEGT